MQDLLESWGERVAREMTRQSISMGQLARVCDVHVSTISRFLNGKLNPNDELKWKIAGALGERMDVLFPWPGIVPPRPQAAVA